MIVSGRVLRWSLSWFLLTWLGLAIAAPVVILPESEPSLIGGLTLAKTSFNPSRGEALDLTLDLKQAADVTVRVFDADWREVSTLVEKKAMPAGESALGWSGKNAQGEVVPDEAYFFTVEAEAGDLEEIYDPTAFSGGEEADLTEASLDPSVGAIRYRLPEMARVNIRIGISGGPLMRTVVDWEPRVAGAVTDYWDGKDLDGLIDLWEHPDRKMIITYFTLPASSVITYGNDNALDLDRVFEADARTKPERNPQRAESTKISRHYRIPRAQDRAPTIKMGFPNQVGEEDGAVVLNGRSIVHVDLDEASKPHFQSAKFEIVFYVDGRFYAEEETGYAPYNWVWDTSQMDEGSYLLTVNVSSFKDQIGIKSARVKIVR
ncbi:FlgD immunoglobulin-like domain containing protein [Thioflavicoccus mobilis]|nr:FlgD immunoglobulin-like domain containing protein [Thioflavicoccus mobilis]